MPELLIDVHSHPILPRSRQSFAKATNQSVDNLKLFGLPVPQWSEQSHLDVMDRADLAVSMFSLPGATAILTGKVAAAEARALNEDMAALIARHPNRFGAFASVPLDDIELAIEETRYALDVLRLDGIFSPTHHAGAYLGEARYDPWFAELDQRGAALFIHPVLPPGITPVPGGLDMSILEFMFDTTRMLTNMVLSGAKARYSRIRMISTHAGGTLPYIVGRMGILEPLFGAGNGRPTLDQDALLKGFASFHYDLTGSTSAATLDALHRLVPAEQLLLGSDYPMMPPETIAPVLGKFRDYAGFDAAQKRAIASGNAIRLFPRFAAATPGKAAT